MASYRPIPRSVVHGGLILLASSLTGCGTSTQPGGEADPPPLPVAASRPVVYTVNYPLQYFAERIGGDLVEVEFPGPPNGDPAVWSPDAVVVAAYQRADLILLNGAGYAEWVDRVTLPSSALVNTSRSFEDRYILVADSMMHTHGPEGEHSHGEVAFTTWLDPSLAIEQARAIREAFGALRPEHDSDFQQGFDALERDLRELDHTIRNMTERHTATTLLASHPVYQYLARRYDLSLDSVHFEPDEYPDADNWRRLEELLAEHPAQWMLWEGEPLSRSVDALAALGVASVVFDPSGDAPATGDFLTVMRTNVENLRRVFTQTRPRTEGA